MKSWANVQYPKHFPILMKILWHVNALSRNGSINTLHYTQTTLEQQGYAIRS
jgi:hypothetical protein